MSVMQRWLADTIWLSFNGQDVAVIYIKFEYGGDEDNELGRGIGVVRITTW